jgi:hypothetical protein
MTTNMYKNLTDSQTPNSLNTILANLAVGDTKHDFGYGKEKLKDIESNYNSGLPASYSSVSDEEVCLNSVIKEYFKKELNQETNQETNIKIEKSYAHIDVSYNHTLTTINDYAYTVSYANVKPKTGLIQAQNFYKQLNIEEDTEVAIVIDATSISFFEILKNGEKMANNVYYIYGPEVINDPATKKSVSSKDFTIDGGVNLIPCLPINPSSFVYEYQFQANKDSLYLDQYFTNYQFDLSEIQQNKMGKSENYLTNLTITYKDPATSEVYNNVLVDSKSKNDISFLSSILTNVIQLLVGKKPFLSGIFGNKKVNPGKNNFLMNSAFQQKRSGDWLQVLLCAALKDKSRGFYSTSDTTKENITKKLQRVFLVTHDRIALAFALLNGIDVIYTHHGKPSLHSAFVYKLNNPEEEEKDKQNLAKQYQEKVESMKEELTNLGVLITKYQEKYYDTYVESKNRTLEIELNNDQSNLVKNVKSESVSADTFNSRTREIFKLALSIVLFQQLLPDFSNLQGEIQNMNDLINRLSTLDPMKDYKEIIGIRNEVVTKIKNTNTILADAEVRFENEVDIATGNEQGKTIKQFRKSITYLNASSWTWDNNLGKRQWSLLTNILDNKNYKSDRNIFLYHLSSLQDNLKQKIAYLYYQYYDLIFTQKKQVTQKMKNVEDASLNTENKAKFDAISLSFCIEVLLTLGGNGGTSEETSITSEEIITTMNKYVTSVPNPYLVESVIVEEDIQFQKELKDNTYVGTGITAEITEDIKEDEIVIPTNIQNTNISTTQETQVTKNTISLKTYSNMDTNTSQATEALMTMILFTDWTTNMIPVTQELLSKNLGRELKKNEENSFIQEDDGTDINTLNINTQVGGSVSVEDVKQFVDQFVNQNPNSTPMETPITLSEDFFKDTSICFHPLLPLYMISRAYYITITNEDISVSWDWELFLTTFTFLKKLKEEVIKTYSGENNTNLDKVNAYIIGLGLREIFFYPQKMNFIFSNIDSSIYSSIDSLLESLSYRISGKVSPTGISAEVLGSEIVKKFGQSIILDETMNSDSITNEELKEQVFQFCDEIASKIIEDRQQPMEAMNLSPVITETITTTTSSSESYPTSSSSDIDNNNNNNEISLLQQEQKPKTKLDMNKYYSQPSFRQKPYLNNVRRPRTIGGEVETRSVRGKTRSVRGKTRSVRGKTRSVRGKTRKYPKKKNQKTKGQKKSSKKKTKKQKRKVSKNTRKQHK